MGTVRRALSMAASILVITAVGGAGGGRAGATHELPGHPAPLYGVTLDSISNLGEIVAGVSRLGERPTMRVYFDVRRSARYYEPAVARLSRHGYVMGELLDSSDEIHISVAAFGDRVRAYVKRLGSAVGIWEIGNEVNGDWTGRYAAVSAKLIEAYRIVSANGGRSALTLYDDIGCGDGPGELGPVAFSKRYVPADVRDGVDDVLLSYYEDECGNRRPSEAAWTAYLGRLHALYPNAELGFGEIGLTAPATSKTLAAARSLIAYYYGLRIRLPYYEGGYFWWYFEEDCLPYRDKPIWSAIEAGFRAEHAAIG